MGWGKVVWFRYLNSFTELFLVGMRGWNKMQMTFLTHIRHYLGKLSKARLSVALIFWEKNQPIVSVYLRRRKSKTKLLCFIRERYLFILLYWCIMYYLVRVLLNLLVIWIKFKTANYNWIENIIIILLHSQS